MTESLEERRLRERQLEEAKAYERDLERRSGCEDEPEDDEELLE